MPYWLAVKFNAPNPNELEINDGLLEFLIFFLEAFFRLLNLAGSLSLEVA